MRITIGMTTNDVTSSLAETEKLSTFQRQTTTPINFVYVDEANQRACSVHVTGGPPWLLPA